MENDARKKNGPARIGEILTEVVERLFERQYKIGMAYQDIRWWCHRQAGGNNHAHGNERLGD